MADAYTNFYQTTVGIAHLGNTRWGWRGSNGALQYHFWSLLFHQGAPSLGAAEGLSKVACPNYYIRHAHNLFGSPENEPWIMAPDLMFVTAPSRIPQGVTVPFPVRVTDAGGAGISGVKVCLHKTNDIYQIGWTNLQGVVIFEVCAQSPGIILVTCSRPREVITPGLCQQYLPCQTTCEVIPEFNEGSLGEKGSLPKELGFTALNPNPAFGDFVVQYGVPVKGRVKLLLYDASGRVEAVLRDEELNPGYYRETFRPHERSVPTGVHFLVLTQNGKKVIQKVVLGR